MTAVASPVRPMPHPALRFRGMQLCATKHFFDGTHRTVSPEETLERIRPHFASSGVTRLAKVTGLDRLGIPTALAYRPNARTLSTSAGKGCSDAAALVSAAMESIEVHHAENLRMPRMVATHDELAAEGVAIPRELLPLSRFSEFRRDVDEEWVMGWDLIGQREVAVPYDTAGMVRDLGRPHQVRMPFTMGSNGLASGNQLLEAISAALLEVIERDAIACSHAVRVAQGGERTRVDLTTVAHPTVRLLLDQLDAAGILPVLYDLTIDTVVPVYQASLYDLRVRHTGVFSGYGAHLDPAVAMSRAITEAAQSRLTYIAGSRDDFFRHDLVRNNAKDDDTVLRGVMNLATAVDASRHRFGATDSFEGDVAQLLEKLQAVGITQVTVVDLTHDEIGIPVARVIVPGLEDFPSVYSRPGVRCRAIARGALPASAFDGAANGR